MNEFTEGFLLQASLILALGAQNLFVLESGLKKQRHFLVASICSICDVLLIILGVMGAASVFVKVPLLKISFGIIGIVVLFYYGLRKIKEAFKNEAHATSSSELSPSIKKTLILSLSFSLLNPHVYLDTVILIGGYSSKFLELVKRVEFGIGAGTFSIIWFFGLAFFASAMSSLLNNQKSMKVISLISGVILLGLSCKLGMNVYSWILG